MSWGSVEVSRTGENVDLQLALLCRHCAVLAHRRPIVREARLMPAHQVLQTDLNGANLQLISEMVLNK